MIPKVVHYVWFGKKPYPKKIEKCIESWHKVLHDYQFIRWDETNFDVGEILFARQAAENGMWAFVSDYVRIRALFEYGGWYLDTDVEVLKPLSAFEVNSVVFGTDENGSLTAVYGTEPHNMIWKHLIRRYQETKFVLEDGSFNLKVINQYIQEEIAQYGYVHKNEFQKLANGILVFPDDFFHVQSLEKGTRHLTENSTCIHWQTMTWTSKTSRVLRWVRLNLMKPILGPNFLNIYINVKQRLFH